MTGIGARFLCLLLALFAAAPAGAAEQEGTLEIRIKDHREAIGDFSTLTLTIEEILISPKPGLKFWQRGWKAIPPATRSIDLTRYIGNNSARLFRGAVDAGSFDALHLKLKGVSGLLKKNSSAAQVKNSVGPIKMAFEIRNRGETLIVLDLVVLDMSDHPPRGYELGIRGYELYADGKLVAKIPPG
jgi:Domain of unknown function (DUF4382)